MIPLLFLKILNILNEYQGNDKQTHKSCIFQESTMLRVLLTVKIESAIIFRVYIHELRCDLSTAIVLLLTNRVS